MDWNRAIRRIEKAWDENRVIEITYHRKGIEPDNHIKLVEGVTEYGYTGETKKAVITGIDELHERTHVIDKIRIW